jgi:hypothetical protein
MSRRFWKAGVAIAALLGASVAFGAPQPPTAPIDLAGPFQTRSPWRLIVAQGPPATDYGGFPAPGALSLCLEKMPGGPCRADQVMPPPQSGSAYDGWEPHYLKTARAVYPRGHGATPLLLIVTASLSAGDGGQVMATQLLKYSRASDAFERVFARSTGTNNNEEIRLVERGALGGDVIVAEPTPNAPFGYWVEVLRPSAAHGYERVLRYRSATRYGDGNALAVIDSEMPAIQQRLGLWRPGAPLPLPASACLKPRLVRTELWCD